MKNTLIKPPFLQPHDRVGILAMASKLDYDLLQPAFKILRDEWQLEVVEGASLRAQYRQFAGTDAQRQQDFQQMLDDPSIKAIFSARGGYGSSRFIDLVSFRKFKQAPKWVVGFSDITAVHGRIQQLGYESLHATMPKLFGNEGNEESVETLRKALFGESLIYQTAPHHFNRQGTAQGILTGGNLCLLAHGLGSRSEIDTRGKILFIEDVEEALYNIDRLMVQLKRANKLKPLAGLIVGQFSESRDNPEASFGKTEYEIIAEHVADYDFPVCYNFPVGHTAHNWAMPVGRLAALNMTDQTVVLTFPEP